AQPLTASTPGLPEGAPEVPVAEPPQQKVGKSGILAFRDQIASVADEKDTIRLGALAHLKAAADASSTAPSALLLNAVPGESGGVKAAGVPRRVGGGGGGPGGRGPMQGVAVGRPTDSLASIGGGGGPRALGGRGPADGTPGRGGPGPARTDEEIQIVFDRHK